MKMMQVELTRPDGEATVHTVVWVDAALKPKSGETLRSGTKPTDLVWTVAEVYPIVQEEKDGGSTWKR